MGNDDNNRDDMPWLDDDDFDDAGNVDNDSTGLTGDLPWMRDREFDAGDTDTTNDEDDLDWLNTLTGDDGSPGMMDDSLGVTGELDWLDDRDADTTGTGDSERLGVTRELSWRDQQTGNFENQLDEAEQAAGIDWGDLGTDDDLVTDDDMDGDGVPDWLQGTSTDNRPPAASATSDLPDWLTAGDDAPSSTRVPDDTDSGAPNWLDDVDTGELEDAVGEQDADWLTDIGMGAADGNDDGAEADWLSAFDEDDDDEAQPASPARAEVPEWLAAAGLSDVADDAQEVDDDFAAMFGGNDSDEADDDGDFDLFGELTGDVDDTDYASYNTNADEQAPIDDDLFGGLFAPDPDEVDDDPRFDDDDDDLDWLGDLSLDDEPANQPYDASAAAQTNVDDLEAFLSTLEEPQFDDYDDERQIETTSRTGSAGDFDDLFSDQEFTDFDPDMDDIDTLRPDRPEWLSDVQYSDVSASAILRRQQDRPMEDLPDRLQSLSERGRDLPGTTTESQDDLATLLPDVDDALPAAVIETSGAGTALTTGTGLTAEQQRRAQMLSGIAGGIGQGPLDIGGMTGAASSEAIAAAQKSSRTGRRIPFKADRLIIALLMATAVLLPFLYSNLRVGQLPPESFATGSSGAILFDQVESLTPGQQVLVAVEYGPTASAELDDALDAVLRHILLRGGQPVIVSTNAVGLLRADIIVSDIASEVLTRNQDYFVTRFLPAEGIGLRTFSQPANLNNLLARDREGNPTGLEITSLDVFSLIVVVAERADAVRIWSEQVATTTTTPFGFAVGFGAAPLAQPYAEAAGTGGLIVGYRDAYTYRQQLNGIYGNDPTPTPTPLPTDTPTDAPTDTPTEEPTPTVAATDTAAATQDETEDVAPPPDTTPGATDEVEPGSSPTIVASDTPEPSETPEATATPEPSATNTPLPTDTPTATATPTATPEPEVFGIVGGTTSVNVRSGPGLSFPPVTALLPGTRVRVLEANEDETWLLIVYDEATGDEGWIFAELLTIEDGEPGAWLPPARIPVLGLAGGVIVVLPNMGQDDEATPVVTPDATDEVEPTTNPTTAPDDLTGLGAPIIDPLADDSQLRDERWFAITFGTLAAIAIITVGNLLGILRNILRRRGG